MFVFTGFMTPASLASCFCVFSTLLDSPVVFSKLYLLFWRNHRDCLHCFLEKMVCPPVNTCNMPLNEL